MLTSIQETHLQMFFVRGLSLLQEVLRQPEGEQGLPQVKSFTKQCLSLLESVFSWPFTQEGKVTLQQFYALVLSLKQKADLAKENDVVSFNPGPLWRTLFVKTGDVLQLFLQVI